MSDLPKPTYDRPIKRTSPPLWLVNNQLRLGVRRKESKRQMWLTIVLALVALFSTAQFVFWAMEEFK